MKVMDLQYVTQCTDNEYWLITIHGADNMLIYIKPSKTLTKQLLKQKDKPKSIKTGVNQIHQASLLPNGTQYRTSNLITNEIWKMIDEDDRCRWRERWHGMDERYTWKMMKERRWTTCRKTWIILWRRYIRYNYYK